MNWRSKTGLILVVLALMLSMVASCTPAASPGKEVTVGHSTTLTGAIASTGVPIDYGYFDYMEWVNEQGGINSVEINVIWEENAGLIPRSITTHKRFARAGAVAEFNVLSSGCEALAPFVQKDEIPLLHETYLTEGMRTDPEPWIFVMGPGWASVASFMLQHIKEGWTESRAPRVGAITYDYASGWTFVNGVEEFAPKFGFEYIGVEVVPLLGAVDTSVEWLRLAAKNPDWILVYASGATFVVLIKDAARLGIQDKGIKIGTLDPLDESVVPTIVGSDADGWQANRMFPLAAETQFPLMNDALDMAGRRGWGPEKVSGVYFSGWFCAQITVEGIRLAIEKVGFENLSGRAVRDGIASIKDFDTGLMAPRFNYHKESPYFHGHSRIMDIQGGKIIPATDWLELPPYYKWY